MYVFGLGSGTWFVFTWAVRSPFTCLEINLHFAMLYPNCNCRYCRLVILQLPPPHLHLLLLFSWLCYHYIVRLAKFYKKKSWLVNWLPSLYMAFPIATVGQGVPVLSSSSAECEWWSKLQGRAPALVNMLSRLVGDAAGWRGILVSSVFQRRPHQGHHNRPCRPFSTLVSPCSYVEVG